MHPVLCTAQVSYGFNYDSSKSHWKPPFKTRVYASGISEAGVQKSDRWEIS